MLKKSRKAVKDSATSFPIVGVGASAGGLEAFTALLAALPTDTGMAFVLVQHLDPAHPSSLTEILARVTRMPVAEITDGLSVRPNAVFVIPAGAELTMAGGVLRLKPRSRTQKAPRPIDTFFRSLAEERGEQSVGVVLSGTGTDGTLGLQCIKEHGGITIAQDESAAYDGMPHSAIAAGVVDVVMPPAAIAAELARISRTPYIATAVGTAPPAPGDGNEFRPVLVLLRHATGVDFAGYKPSTIQRRIMRRVLLSQRRTLAEYVQLLRENATEVQALYQDLLINVTEFFRNPDAFAALKTKVFPRLLRECSHENPLRIWVVGCSTGQEVYSLAISFREFAGERPLPFRIFGTDLNEAALEKARAGYYPKALLQDVSAERLRRFFVESAGGYQVEKSLREACVFARHNVVSDPPFSRIDLISCRNLLIYIEPNLQKQVLPLFHYALRPGGFLLLGASESVGTYSNLFTPHDNRHKLYVRKPAPIQAPFSFAGRPADRPPAPRTPLELPVTKLDPARQADRLLLARFAPPGVLINADMEIFQFRGETGRYLQPAPGRPTHNLLKMARGGLVVPLRQAVERAKKENSRVRVEQVRFRSGKGHQLINIEILPVANLTGADRCWLVLFEPVAPAPGKADKTHKAAPAGRAARPTAAELRETDRLKRELVELKEYLQAVIEQQDATHEELQATSEEMQSSNEELQSINEELETSKEELQATNEELTTLNEELSRRSRETARLNDDLNNLVRSAAIPILIVDAGYRLRRFTPKAEEVFDLKPTDLGRLLADVNLGWDLPELPGMLAAAMANGTLGQCEVTDHQGRWHLLRVHPYRTQENHIEGAVLALVDVDMLKRRELELKASRDYAESILRTTPDPLLVLDAQLRVETANGAFYTTFQIDPSQAEGRLVYELGNGQWDIPRLRELLEQVLPEASVFSNFEVTHQFENIGRRSMLLNARTLADEAHQPQRILLGIRDITERQQAEEVLRQAQRQLTTQAEAALHGTRAQLIERAAELTAINRQLEGFVYTIAHDLRAPLRSMQGFATLLLREAGGGLSEDARDFARRISDSAKFMDALLLDLLAFSQLSQKELSIKPVELEKVVHTVLGQFTETMAEKKAELEAAGPWPAVLAHGPTLQQVLTNLLSNALKFTRPEVPPRIRLWTEERNGMIRVWVEDNGLGIAPQHQAQVFQVFTRLHGSGYPGTGIGLAIVQQALMRMGGHSGVESVVGQGSRFWIELMKGGKPS